MPNEMYTFEVNLPSVGRWTPLDVALRHVMWKQLLTVTGEQGSEMRRSKEPLPFKSPRNRRGVSTPWRHIMDLN